MFSRYLLPTNGDFGLLPSATFSEPEILNSTFHCLVGQAYAQGIVTNSFQKALLYVGLYWPLSISWHVTIW